jgi:aminopeptidase N
VASRQLELNAPVRVRLLAPVVAAALLVSVGGQASADGGSTVVAGGPYTAALSHPRVDPYYPAEGTTSIDALHYGLNLSWNGVSHELSGTATIRFRATRDESEISLDFGSQLEFTAIRLDGAIPRGAGYGVHKLRIFTKPLKANSRHTLVIRYHGKPRPVAAPSRRSDIPDVGWTVQPDGEAWTLQEPFGAYTWYPVNDQPSDKAYYDITWHTKAAWRGVSNGRLVSDKVVGGERTMHWHLASPAASYLVTAAIGPYREYRQRGPHGLPITFWVRNADKRVLPALRHTPAMIRWLEARLGPFPFDRIGAVVVPTNSSVETQTLVTIGPSVLESRAGLSDLLHEYSHQWYGDEVTPNNWKDLWLNESFAMFIQFTWEASHGETTTARWHALVNSYDYELRRLDGPPGDYHRSDFAELNVYYCGARMLARLQAMLGASLFAKVIRDWPALHRYGNADRNSWIDYLDRTTGRDLRPFVTKWLNDPNSPA